MKIYLITKGSYSDYHICAVTTDEEKAKQLKKIFSNRLVDAEIEEYETVEDIGRYKNYLEGRPLFIVDFLPSGDVRQVRENNYAESWIDGEIVMNPYSETLTVAVDAPTQEVAIKIAAERRAEYLAEKNGIA